MGNANPLTHPFRKILELRSEINHFSCMYSVKLELKVLPSSNNVALRSHWRSQRSHGKMWDALIRATLRGKLPAEPLSRARIKITRNFWQTLDYDNFVGSLKPVVDAIVTAGVLKDDSWNVLGAWTVDQKFRPKNAGPLLEIEIHELSPDAE